jgi:hypothetical protein
MIVLQPVSQTLARAEPENPLIKGKAPGLLFFSAKITHLCTPSLRTLLQFLRYRLRSKASHPHN